MSDLAELMKSYLSDSKTKLDYNLIPGKVLRYCGDVSINKIRESYYILTGKDWVDITDIEIIQEMIFILLNKLRGDI